MTADPADLIASALDIHASSHGPEHNRDTMRRCTNLQCALAAALADLTAPKFPATFRAIQETDEYDREVWRIHYGGDMSIEGAIGEFWATNMGEDQIQEIVDALIALGTPDDRT